MKPITNYVGLDVHNSTISVAVADEGRRGEVRHHGVVENRADIVILLGGLGHDCTVVAPSLIPQKPGDRVKTNWRNAAMLARMHRAEELTEVWVPDAAHEAMRDLVRARALQRAFWPGPASTLVGFCYATGVR